PSWRAGTGPRRSRRAARSERGRGPGEEGRSPSGILRAAVRPRVLALATLAGVLAGCAGVRLVDGSYVVRRKGYRVGAPAGWMRLASEADLALRQPELDAGLLANATCEGKTPRRPLPVLARHLRFGLRDVRDLAEAPVELG